MVLRTGGRGRTEGRDSRQALPVCAGREEAAGVQGRGVTEEGTKASSKVGLAAAAEGRQTRRVRALQWPEVEGAGGPRYRTETIGCHEENEGRGISIIL
jgi:hypothetical protein